MTAGSASRAVRILVLAAVAAALMWLVATRSLAMVLAGVDPGAALILNPGSPTALIRMAERRLGQDPTDPEALEALPAAGLPSVLDKAATIVATGIVEPMLPPDLVEADRVTVRALATAAWRAAPLDPRPPRLLGQLAVADEDSRPLMTAAMALSRHDILAVYWLLQDAFIAGDHDRVLTLADILLRGHPDADRFVQPILAILAETPEARPALSALLRAGPPWRDPFFEALPKAAADPRVPLDLLVDVAAGPTPPTEREVLFYLRDRVAKGDHRLAREAWRALPIAGEPRGDDLLFDGGFRAEPGVTPFSWAFSFDSGVRITTAAAPGRPAEQALRLEFGGQMVAGLAVTQVVVLPPGDYVVTGLESGLFDARHGLTWALACLDAVDRPLGRSEPLFGAGDDWRAFRFDLSVPATGCPTQVLTLTLETDADSERIVKGEVYMTDLAIRPRSG